jgi:translation initiation factor IF-2
MRVYELAKELGLSTKELMDILAQLKMPVKSHSSSLTVSAEERIREFVAATRATRGKKGAALTQVSKPASEAPAPPRIDARTPTGERILGVRKIVIPPPAPAPVEVPPVLLPEPPARMEAGPRVVMRPAAAAPATQVAPAPPEAPGAPAMSSRPQAAPAPAASAAGPAAPPAEARPFRPAPSGPGRAVRIEPVRPPKREPHREAPREAPGRVVVPADAPRPAAPARTATPDRRRPATDGKPAAGRPRIEPRRPMRRLPRRRRPMRQVEEQPVVAAAAQVAGEVELVGPITVGDLAARLQAPAGEIVRRLLDHGVLAGLNQQVPLDLAKKVAESFGATVRRPAASSKEEATTAKIERLTVAAGEGAPPRPPVVTVMGHVDHGKTTLLDAIRKTKVAEGEFGGITQHIGASVVEVNGKSIVFIDTPGHEAFTALRARGAQVTDLAVLVVAADDGVMPQTIEAIHHARAAGVPIIVAINKIDLPGVNPDRVKQALVEHGLVPEEWGGETIMAPVSARQGTGLDHLLEMILLVAELQDLRADVDRPARGTVIEARLDRGRGPVATVLIQEGRLKITDTVVTGESYGRVRAMFDARGNRVAEATPSTPVEVVGLVDVPTAGDLLEVVRDERMAKAVAEERRERRRAAEMATTRRGAGQETANGPKELRLIVKADAHGSVEALTAAIPRLPLTEVALSILHAGVGNISESDIMLAAASRAVVIGFNVRPDAQVRRFAEEQGVDMRLYRVIYEALDDLVAVQKGLFAPKMREVALGQAEVRQVFTIKRLGVIGGSYVTNGRIVRGAMARLIRDGVIAHAGRIGSLRRFKDDVREVTEGFECGIGLERFNDVKEHDIIEAYEIQQVPA